MFALLLGSLSLGCDLSANKPRWRLTPVAAGAKLEPAPPARVYWLRVIRAELPAKTKVGAAWDQGDGPDPFFVLYAKGKELMRSKPEPNELKPRWADGPRGNFELPRSTPMRIEVFDSDPLQEHRMGSASFLAPGARELTDGQIELELDQGGSIWLAVERAHPMMGLGFTFVVRNERCRVVEALKYSPVGRGGMRAGDRLLVIGGRKTQGLRAEQIRGLLEAAGPSSLELVVQHERGAATENMMVKRGVTYPLFKEYGRVD